MDRLLDHGLQPIDHRCRCRASLWLGITALLICLGFAALPIDVFVSRWLTQGNLPDPLRDVLRRSETFAHGIGIAIILIVLGTIDVQRRWAMPRVVGAVAAAGLMANIVKLLVGRARPHAFDLAAPIADSFNSWFPMFAVGSADRSTPSAHTAAVVAFALALAWLYPRGRWLFAALAVLAAGQRIDSGSHFLSDVCWGAAVGWFVSRGVISGWLSLPAFNRWEARRHAQSIDGGKSRFNESAAMDGDPRANRQKAA